MSVIQIDQHESRPRPGMPKTTGSNNEGYRGKILLYLAATPKPIEFKVGEYSEAEKLYMERADADRVVLVHHDGRRSTLLGGEKRGGVTVNGQRVRCGL